ncbi:MAG: hypothetical protein QOG52_66 [Frankiaceae bacterium]|jgi:hypothetical protein|nr:hypothetical protein [Frankiaceae bacterium]
MRGRRSARVRTRRRVSAVGLLPALFLGAVSVAAPFAGTTTATVANTHKALKPAVTADVVYVDPAATTYLVQLYLAIAALAAAIILFAIAWLRTAEFRQSRREYRQLARASAVWTDALTTTARTGRSPVRAPRALRPRSWPAASAQRG